MAAGGPKSAAFAGIYADGLITSVKDPADTVAKVIEPYRKAATEVGKEHRVLATRWTVLADGPDEAWPALSSMRGLRAPGRLEATDPAELRFKADEMDRAEVLSSYTVVPDAAGLVAAYQPAGHRRRRGPRLHPGDVGRPDGRHRADRQGGPAPAACPGRLRSRKSDNPSDRTDPCPAHPANSRRPPRRPGPVGYPTTAPTGVAGRSRHGPAVTASPRPAA